MSKIAYDTPMFYPGYPIFIAMTRLADGEVLATSYSSSYALGNLFVMGVSADGNTGSALQEGSSLSINFLSEQEGLLSDIAGLISRRHKLAELVDKGAEIADYEGVPYIQNGPATLIGEVAKVIQTGGIAHLFVIIHQHLIREELIGEDQIKWESFDTLEYFGARADRIYRGVNTACTPRGLLLKAKNRERFHRRHETA